MCRLASEGVSSPFGFDFKKNVFMAFSMNVIMAFCEGASSPFGFDLKERKCLYGIFYKCLYGILYKCLYGILYKCLYGIFYFACLTAKYWLSLIV